MPNLRTSLVLFLTLIVIGALFTTTAALADAPWWDQGKTRFFWNQWRMLSPRCVAHVDTDGLMDSLAKVGATVFVDVYSPPADWGSWRERAVAAKKRGIRFFGQIVFSEQVRVKNEDAQLAVFGDGNSYPSLVYPFYKQGYEEWILKPAIEMAKSGLVDGMHIDWENYGYGEGSEPYNDDCFSAFLKSKGIAENVPRAGRGEWMVKRNLREEYLVFLHDLTKTMFSEFAAKVRKIKPDFVFSSYDERFGGEDMERGGWRSSGIAAGLHKPSAPYFIIDPRWYCNYYADPWWDSFDGYYHGLGYKHIGGTWDRRYSGGQPMVEDSIVQWMYDSAMHMDGCWVWLENSFGPHVWQAFAAADRRIRATEVKIGKYLLKGKRDIRFVTVVESSGNPDMDRKVKQRTYHLGNEWLVRVNNVDSYRPTQVRLRFPSPRAGSRWTVRDPISGLYFSADGRSVVWDAKQLFEGLAFPLEKRSEQFVLISPAKGRIRVSRNDLLPNQADIPMGEEFRETPTSKTDPSWVVTETPPDRLLFLKTVSPEDDNAGPLVVSGIYSADTSTGRATRLRHDTRSNLWSPSWSPDRKRVLFTHYANGRGQIYSMNADGTGVVNLSKAVVSGTGFPKQRGAKQLFCDKLPVWSPNGRRIAFVSDRDGDWEIYVMNVDGSGRTRLTRSPGEDSAPAWSSDGGRIVFESDRSGRDTDIYVMNADGSDQSPIIARAGDDLEPTWSPDGKRIAATCVTTWQRSLCIADVATGDVTVATSAYLQTQPHMYVESPRWSPDGRRIAAIFYNDEGYDNSGITVYDLIVSPGEKMIIKKKSGAGTLVNVSSVRTRPGGGRSASAAASSYSDYSSAPAWITKKFYGLTWSPDGKKLAFLSDMDESGAFYVYTVPVPADTERRNHDTVGFYLYPRGSVDNVAVSVKGSDGEWRKVFTDDFERGELGKDWKVLEGQFSIEGGKLSGSGYIICTRSFPGSQRMEYEASDPFNTAGDLSALLSAIKEQHPLHTPRNLLFAFRSSGKTSGIELRGKVVAKNERFITPGGKTDKILCERDGANMRQIIEGTEARYVDTESEWIADAPPVEEPSKVPGSVSSWPQDVMWGTK